MSHTQPIQQSSIQVSESLENVEKILQWLESLMPKEIDKTIYLHCKIALIEAFTTIVGMSLSVIPQSRLIELEIQIFTNSIEMRIWNKGRPLLKQDSLDSLRPKTMNNYEQYTMGIPLIERLVDEVSYQRLPDQRNCLFMQKQLY